MTRRTFNDDDDKFFRRVFGVGVVAWVVGVLVVLAFWIAVIWGIIALVSHFTS